MQKTVLVAFNGEITCFVHVLLNALDMAEKGFSVKVVIEGAATKLIPGLAKEEGGMASLYKKVKELKLIDCVCQACAAKMGTLDAVTAEGLPLCAEMKGHPSLGRYQQEGYTVITF